MANLTTLWQLSSGTWWPNPRFLRIKECQIKTNAPSRKLRPSSTKCNCRDFFNRIVTVTFWLHLLSRLFFFHEMTRKIGWRLEMSTNVATKAQRPSHFHHFFQTNSRAHHGPSNRTRAIGRNTCLLRTLPSQSWRFAATTIKPMKNILFLSGLVVRENVKEQTFDSRQVHTLVTNV